MSTDHQDVVEHFTARAQSYERSSRWCQDSGLLDAMFELSRAGRDSTVLDAACGTGLVAARFHGRVRHLVGVDITPAMARHARTHLDDFVLAPLEALPFPHDHFDAVVCRQGLQFVDLARALPELRRVLRPGGRIVSADLHAYGPDDRDAYFEILRLRNPARRNFFVQGDMARQLRTAGFREVESRAFVSREDVDIWSANGAIGEERREAIRALYRAASPEFRTLHAVREEDGRVFDDMLFLISAAER